MKKNKTALIFGVTGQDGSYLAEFLINKKYIVHGVKRKSSSFNTERIDFLFENQKNFFLHYGDLSDTLSVQKLLRQIKPDEVYNLAAQSHVAVSFDLPEYTSNINAIGTLRILDSIKSLKMEKKIKFYQAGTSEMFGLVKEIPQNENTPFYPRSPYGVSKVFSHWITQNYREAYGLFACNGILFNHESPRRGETFVTKKIVSALVKIKFGIQKNLILGNLYAKRDWGHAKDYVSAMWLMLQQKKADDFVIASEKQYTVKKFIQIVSKKLRLNLVWKGKGLNERAYYKNNIIIKISKKYIRPTEVDTLLGNSKKAKKILKWKPKMDIYNLADDMISCEIKKINENK